MDDLWSINPWLVLSRFIHFGSCLLLFGFCAFDRFIAVPEAASQWRIIYRRWMLLSLPLAILSGAAWFVWVASDMSGLPLRDAMAISNLALVLNHTHFGGIWRIRALLWLTTAITTIATLSKPTDSNRWAASLCSAALLASLAWAGHGQFGASDFHLVADGLHLLIAGLWPTGLLPLTLLLFKLRRNSAGIINLIRRFSAMSLMAAAAISITGFINSDYLVGSFANLWPMLYGRVLLLKVTLFCIMVAVGAVNLLYLKPRLIREAPNGSAATKLRITVGIELILGILVIALVALLGLLPPAKM